MKKLYLLATCLMVAPTLQLDAAFWGSSQTTKQQKAKAKQEVIEAAMKDAIAMQAQPGFNNMMATIPDQNAPLNQNKGKGYPMQRPMFGNLEDRVAKLEAEVARLQSNLDVITQKLILS